MSEAINQVLTVLGGGAVALGIVAWLARSLVLNLLNKDIETYKHRLQSEHAVETERLRHALALSGKERELVMSQLISRRTETISTLYEKIIDYLGAAESYSAVAEYTGEDSKDDKQTKFGESAADFREYFLKNRIWFSREICQAIDELWREVYKPASRYSMWRNMAKRSDSAHMKESEAWDEAYDAIRERVPPLLDTVEDEFRALLGVVERGLESET